MSLDEEDVSLELDESRKLVLLRKTGDSLLNKA